MAMDFILKIKIANSDVDSTKRIYYATEKIIQDQKTTGFYTYDDIVKYNQIINWFHNFKKPKFCIDIEATQNYVNDVKNYVFACLQDCLFNTKSSLITLEKYDEEVQKFFDNKKEDEKFLSIKPMILTGEPIELTLTGQQKRYLSFNIKECKISECFVKLLFNKSEINIYVKNKKFIIYPQLSSDFTKKIINK